MLGSSINRREGERRWRQGDHWAWKAVESRKTIFQAWIVMENSRGHGKSWKAMEKSRILS